MMDLLLRTAMVVGLLLVVPGAADERHAPPTPRKPAVPPAAAAEPSKPAEPPKAPEAAKAGEAHAPAVAPSEPAAETAGHQAHAASEPEEIWKDLIEGNRRFVEGKPRKLDLAARRAELAKGQHPRTIVLGCSDSRVSPSLVFDQSLGDLFEVRTAGNIADPIALGSIEYAAEHLHAKVLLVLGHESCGAVAAAAAGARLPTANLEAIVNRIAPALAELKGSSKSEGYERKAVEANVHQSAMDTVQRSPIVQKDVDEGKLTVIKAVYSLKTGEVRRLE